MAISKEQILDIKNSVNIVDIISEVVPLTRSGRHFLGLCPFHKEKTPSFNVIEDHQFFHCFGCGKSGDVFRFLEDYYQIPFIESVRLVADRSGMDLPAAVTMQEKTVDSPNQPLFDLHADATKFYHAILMTTKEGEQAKRYLYERGLTDEDLRNFQIGLSPDQPDYLYQVLKDKSDEVSLGKSGLFTTTDTGHVYDVFQNRIMFPLLDDQSRVIGFSGRIWTDEDTKDQKAKYKNTRSTPIFNKSYELYHLDKAKHVAQKVREIYIMEGFMDVIAAHKAGIENAVASMGTALTNDHVTHLRKYVKKVILTYDGDRAGQAAISKALELLSDMSVEIVRLPDQLDPDDFFRKYGAEELKRVLSQSRISSTEFWLAYLKPENIDNLQAQIAYVERVAKLIAKVPSLTAQNTYIHQLADSLPAFDYSQVELAVNQERLTNREKRRIQTTQQPVIVRELTQTPTLSTTVRAESQLFHRLLHHDLLLNRYRNREDFTFETIELNVLYDLLKKNGQITSMDLADLPESVSRAYYRILEEQLPPEVSEEEIIALENRLNQLKQDKAIRVRSSHIKEASSHGDVDHAIDELDKLIAQKRRLE